MPNLQALLKALQTDLTLSRLALLTYLDGPKTLLEINRDLGFKRRMVERFAADRPDFIRRTKRRMPNESAVGRPYEVGFARTSKATRLLRQFSL